MSGSTFGDIEMSINSETFRYAQRQLEALRIDVDKVKRWDPDDEICKQMVKQWRSIQNLIGRGRVQFEELEAQLDQIDAIVNDLEQTSHGVEWKESCGEISCLSQNQPAGDNVTKIATFMYPNASSNSSMMDERVDHVRRLAANNELTGELAQFPALTVSETQTSVLVNSFRSWTSQDDVDAEELAAERMATVLLQIRAGAEVIAEVQGLIDDQVEQQQGLLAAVESNMAIVAENTAGALNILQTTHDTNEEWIHTVWKCAILGIGTVAVGGAVVSGCGACIIGRSAAAATALLVNSTAKKARKKWQDIALNNLPRDFLPLPLGVKDQLIAAGNEAEARLLRKLESEDAWCRCKLAPYAGIRGFATYYRKSDVHKYSAWKTYWDVQLEAKFVFRKLFKLIIGGSLDSGCGVIWCRPVDKSTFVRYTVFSEFMHRVCRDFHCICRCGKVDSDDDREEYVFAVSSLRLELLRDIGLPLDNDGIQHGWIHVSGVRVTALTEQCSRIEVMTDVEPDAPGAFLIQDAVLRNHVVGVAATLHKGLFEQT